jgi:hypothetical protein
MGWWILVNFIRQPMLKLPTHSGFHEFSVPTLSMSKQVGDYFWMKIKENYHINDSKFSSSHSEKVFSYTWLLSNSLDQSGHQQHHAIITGTFKYSDSWVLRHFHFGNQS